MALTVIFINALAIPNVGTLYRMRLAPWHVLIGLGMIFAMQFFDQLLKHLKTANRPPVC